MGISDEDYADALEHQRAHQVALIKLELEKQKEERKMAGLVGTYPANITSTTLVSNGTGTTFAANPYLATSATRVGEMGIKALTEKDLTHDAMQAPLSALIDMWQMRWQGEWVSETAFQEDDFWRLALLRLSGANKLERHHLASSYAPVYRIIE